VTKHVQYSIRRLPAFISLQWHPFKTESIVIADICNSSLNAPAPRPKRIAEISVCVLCGSPVWPSPPVVGPLWGPPLCVGPLFGSPVWVPCMGPLCVGPLCVGPLCGSPVWVPCVGPSAPARASCGIYSRDVSRSFTRSRSRNTLNTASAGIRLWTIRGRRGPTSGTGATKLWFESHGGPGASRSRRAVWVIAPSSLFR